MKRSMSTRLFRPGSVLLPLSLLAAALLGRGGAALGLFTALYGVRLLALATSESLRAAFALQPSMRYVQGSVAVALGVQAVGATLAALLCWRIPQLLALLPLVPCGLLLNIESVFNEYLYALGDRQSALTARGFTSGLTLLGLILCAPSRQGLSALGEIDFVWPLVTSALSALIGLFAGLALGGRPRPRPNPEPLRHAPLALLQSGLYPALALAVLAALFPVGIIPAPLFAGLALYEGCRTPFRRSAMESRPLNRALLVAAGIGAAAALAGWAALKGPFGEYCRMSAVSILLAAACAFALFGRLERRDEA